MISGLITLLYVAAAPPAPCTTATPDCTEWVVVGSGRSRSLVYRTNAALPLIFPSAGGERTSAPARP